MNDEIKEILEALKPYEEEFIKAGLEEHPLYLYPDQQKILLDYITNLQKEYETELDENLKLSEWLVKKQKRIEKARDKIQYIIDYGFDYDGFNTVESLKGLIDMLVDYAKQSKDILNGGDE